jgi:predicted ATPase
MISELHLNNFKCFADQRLPFRRLTLLSGLNGMGKTSAIQALLLLRQSYEQGLLQTTGLALNGDLTRVGTASDALFEGAEEDTITFSITSSNKPPVEWRFAYDRERDVLERISPPVPPDAYDTSLFAPTFRYLQAERLGPRTSFEMSDFWVRQRRQIGVRGEFTAHFLSAFGRETIPLPTLRHPSAESLDIKDQVEAWIGEITPGTRLQIANVPSLDVVNLQFSFVAGEQLSNPYRATNVGFGLTYTLPIIVSALSSPPGSLLVIENPEAHLHPKGQSRIGELLARAAAAGIQVVIETHSDHVLNAVRIAVHDRTIAPGDVALHFFQRSGDNRVSNILSPELDGEGRISSWPDDFFDEWDRSLEALLKPAPR